MAGRTRFRVAVEPAPGRQCGERRSYELERAND